MTGKKRPSIVALGAAVAFAFVATSACATARRSSSSFGPLPAPEVAIELASIELEAVYSYSESLDEIGAVILSRAAKERLSIKDGRAGAETAAGPDNPANPSISFFFRERQYAKGLKTLYSLAILAELRDASGNVVLRSGYFRDGVDSFESFAVLDESLGAILGEVSRALRKAK